MKRQIITSADGSPTIYVEELDEHYHSTFGARNESEHVFITAGLDYFRKEELNILEIGFGTGLNAYLTVNRKKEGLTIRYYAIEKYPLLRDEWKQLNYERDEDSHPEVFHDLHECSWECWNTILPDFKIYKSAADLNNFSPPPGQDLIYFDAFAPDVQPGLWSHAIFEKLYSSLNPGGILVTYSVKGSVRRTMTDCGFRTEKLPGPRGKRHMLRACK